jgi:hypothetical protein
MTLNSLLVEPWFPFPAFPAFPAIPAFSAIPAFPAFPAFHWCSFNQWFEITTILCRDGGRIVRSCILLDHQPTGVTGLAECSDDLGHPGDALTQWGEDV